MRREGAICGTLGILLLQLLLPLSGLAENEQGLLTPEPKQVQAAPESNTPAPVPGTQVNLKPEPLMPADVTLKPDQPVMRYLLQHDFFNAFPDNLFHPNDPISRAEYITLLYRASAQITPFVSEFAYFRDVPTSYWAYFPIEAFRMRDVLHGENTGYLKPDAPISNMEAGVMLSKTLPPSWLVLSPQELSATLSAYIDGRETVPSWARYDLARTIYSGFLLPTARQTSQSGIVSLMLDLNAPLTRMDAARMVYRRALLEDEEQEPESQRKLWLPPGIHIAVTPTSTISSRQLSVGEIIYFSLIDAVQIPQMGLDLERGTRVHGRVTEISGDKMQALVVLDKATLPSGDSYNMRSNVSLRFTEDKNKQVVIVPGQALQIETLPPE